MVKTTAPSSRSRAASDGAGGRGRAAAGRQRLVDVGDWVGGLRLSGFTVIMLGLVILGALVLVPTVGTYLDQRAQIAALEEAVQVGADEVEALEAERDQWRDPAYITTEARERLYYHFPGEVVYLIDDDLPDSALPGDTAAVSDEVVQTHTDWMSQFVRSLVASGSARTAVPAP